MVGYGLTRVAAPEHLADVGNIEQRLIFFRKIFKKLLDASIGKLS